MLEMERVVDQVLDGVGDGEYDPMTIEYRVLDETERSSFIEFKFEEQGKRLKELEEAKNNKQFICKPIGNRQKCGRK